jgi:hypothetical protein
MPQGLVAALPIIFEAVAAGAGAAGLGYTLANQPGGGPSPAQQQAALTAQQNAQTAATRRDQAAAVARTLPNLQEQQGGSLSPDTLMQEALGQVGATGQYGAGTSGMQAWLGDRNLTGIQTAGLTSPVGGATPTGTTTGSNFWENLQPTFPAGSQQVTGAG